MSTIERSLRVAALLGSALALLLTGVAQAAERHPHTGRLPGFPAMRGVVPVLGSAAQVAARDELVRGAFARARARQAGSAAGPVEPNERFFSECEDEPFFFSTQDVCYRGGPVLHDPIVHLILWQGPIVEDTPPPGSHVQSFPPHYVETVERYFTDLAHDNAQPSATLANAFAVQPQYYEEEKGELVEGSAAISFEVTPADVEVDNSAFPSRSAGECKDETAFSEGPCLLDSDIQAEVAKVAGTTSKGLGDLYVVLTPPGVGGCFEAGECAYQQYCAYHGDFGGDGVTVGQQTIYADLPYLGEVPGCDSGVHPNEELSAVEEKEGEGGILRDRGADAVIDTASHEVNEAISDPIGSQCKSGATSAGECERNAWTDAIGQEVADKCLPPESTILGIYGEPLGEVVPGHATRAFNQEIDGHRYYTQRVWSNEAGLFEGGCVQRRIDAHYTISAKPQATVPMTLNGSSSGASGDPATYWIWNFGGGEQIGTESPTLSHTFATPGAKQVALTAFDAYGNSQAAIEEFTVAAAPLPPAPPSPPASAPALVAPAPITVIVKEAVAPAHVSAAQLATKLGLPTNGRKLSGAGPFALGHGQCPPACDVRIQLYTTATASRKLSASSKLVRIGSAHVALVAKAAGKALSLSPSAKGRELLRKRRTLACKLVVTVEGQEGGSWQIVRALTLSR